MKTDGCQRDATGSIWLQAQRNSFLSVNKCNGWISFKKGKTLRLSEERFIKGYFSHIYGDVYTFIRFPNRQWGPYFILKHFLQTCHVYSRRQTSATFGNNAWHYNVVKAFEWWKKPKTSIVQNHEFSLGHGQHQWIEQRLVYKIGKYGQIQSSYFGVLEFKK